MKKLMLMALITMLILSACSSHNDDTKSKYEPEEDTKATNEASLRLEDISDDDQKQVEQLIEKYFKALEKKDYDAAWELTSSTQKRHHPKSEYTDEHVGVESIKLVSMKGYLPVTLSETGEVPQGVNTIWFEVKLDIKPKEGSAWDDGENLRFVVVEKEDDGSWRIDALGTNPQFTN
jgi:hypothetical protein